MSMLTCKAFDPAVGNLHCLIGSPWKSTSTNGSSRSCQMKSVFDDWVCAGVPFDAKALFIARDADAACAPS